MFHEGWEYAVVKNVVETDVELTVALRVDVDGMYVARLIELLALALNKANDPLSPKTSFIPYLLILSAARFVFH